MGKSTHFIGQPMYNQALKLLDKSKILRISREKGGERYTKRLALRPDECPSKFQVVPKQWIVERTFAWLENFRRLTIDYEFHAETAVTMIQLAFCFHDT